MSYTTADTRQMDGIDHARLRVGNALGTNPYETAVREIIDNGFDEVSAGHADTVTIVLRGDESIEVIDNGRGVPVDFNEKSGDNGVVLLLGRTLSGGKFDANTGSAGLNGIGAAATNAISDRFDVTVWRGGKEYRQNFHRGRPGHFAGTGFDPGAEFRRAEGEKLRGFKPRAGAPAHGTSVRLVLDRTVARDAPFDIRNVLFRARCSSLLLNGSKLVVVNDGWREELPTSLVGEFSGHYGARALLEFVSDYHGMKRGADILEVEGKAGFVNVRGDAEFTYRVAAQPSDGDSRIWGFANGVYTVDGGSHVPATARGIGAALAERASRLRNLGLQKGEQAPGADDFAAVCTAVVAVIAPEVDFKGQAKDSIDSKSLNANLAKDLERKVSLWAAAPSNTDAVTVWAKTALEYARTKRSVESARARRRTQRLSSGLGENLGLPDKLLPSQVSGRGSGAELFIAEGDSALGTIKAARDSMYQACFPLKGKPINAYNMTLAKARANAEFDAIERILGCGAKDRCDPEACRYDRIMFASDADPDGGNINSLLTCMFLEFFRPLVESGMVYVTMPPLFVVRQGETRVYCQTENDRDVAVAELKAKSSSKVEVQRNKGLGEMNPDDFWNTVLDPTQRTVMQLTVPDGESADKLNYTLFGGPAQGRREWIADMSARMDLAALDLSD